MIKASKISFKWTNRTKQERIESFLDAYRSVLRAFIDSLWDLDTVPKLASKELTSVVDPQGLSARAVQAAFKQASGVVRGTKAKTKRRLFVLKQLEATGDLKGATKLRAIIDKNPLGKPECGEVCPELDSRFCSIKFDTPTSFEFWLTLSSLGKPFGKLNIPFNRNKHFNKMMEKGAIKTGVRLSKAGVTFLFELPVTPRREIGATLGVDIGQRHTVSVSNGFQPGPNKHGHDLTTISRILARRKRGSGGFQRASIHRDNYVNWSINQLDLTGVRQVNREDLKNLRKSKTSSRGLAHWKYPAIIGKLESRCQELGVLVQTFDPAYTSQRCFECGFTRKGNRKRESFKCGACGYTADADLNASLNISLDLPSMGGNRCLERNREGFYWIQVDGSM